MATNHTSEPSARIRSQHVGEGDDALRKGYAAAAQVLVDQARHGDHTPQTSDGLYRAALFCLRHFAELSLKRWCQQLTKAGIAQYQGKLNHGLLDRWVFVLETLEDRLGVARDANLGALDIAIQKLAALDPDSMTFRYASDRKGHPIGELLLVAPSDVAALVSGIVADFEVLDFGVDCEVYKILEIQDYYRDDYER